jgi:ABC-type cobalamin/Fe3+-siderophores transport system ATPase subunit
MQSFRGIDDLTLEFPADEPIVFIGINGVGKSSILDCLAILLSWLIAQVQFDPKALGSFMRMEDGDLVSDGNKLAPMGVSLGKETLKMEIVRHTLRLQFHLICRK